MSYRIVLMLLVLSGVSQAADSYKCTLSVRDNLMQNFEVVVGEFDGDQQLNLKSKKFRLQVSTPGAAGSEKLALWLGVNDSYSAVTTSRLGEPNLYLNMIYGEAFAVANCDKQ